MAQFQHLNVYKKAFDFLVKITQSTTNFPRDYRYTLGEKLNNGCIDFITMIYKANNAKGKERAESITVLLEELQKINVLVRLCAELRNISKDRYMELALLTQDIEKQLNGWKSHTESQAYDPSKPDPVVL